ncbi:GTP cyclohydrolase FolE2 [Marinobacter sp. F3R08]|uniref:GTP cyclohydrolase FolE2 n=1 Tax=Marinobacter sp. F3R08 TaxID=2841559 RepID=UPI001C07F56D|nr:GTP cyclohydrolase FolE2 [Marinobacter sp. F3R08]MBU2954747.1 GTP cyclohydrolase I FolE2 [Marinobacter sp. F3R08]
MEKELPDVASNETPQIQAPLEWVGMSGIDVPVNLAEQGCAGPLHAVVDARVNLPVATVKGIHMSRLYRILDDASRQEVMLPEHLKSLLEQMVHSHRDCHTDSAKLCLDFKLLARRPALQSPDLAGWKAYPVRIEATLIRGVFKLKGSITVEYSSTCPCSAALARQLIAQFFWADFPQGDALAREDVVAWLEKKATLATPHSQRSEASVSVDILASAPTFGLMSLIEQVESALKTPVQTAVKRADEQAFALLNGQNLMYVEDAARRIQSALSGHFTNVRTHVRHLESLHSHDAVASAV